LQFQAVVNAVFFGKKREAIDRLKNAESQAALAARNLLRAP
jgi:hypothetical protein